MSKFLQRLRRQQGDDLAPLERITKQVGKDLETFAISQGALVAKVLTAALRSARVPRGSNGYIFWLLVERPDLWPTLNPARRTALERAVYLMEQSNSTPSYTSGFDIPDEYTEAAVEGVIEEAAVWAYGPLRAKLLHKYMELLDGKKEAAALALKTDPDDGRARLEASLLGAVKRHPRWFTHLDLLYWALKPFLR